MHTLPETRLAEVVSSSITGFVAECLRGQGDLDLADVSKPRFGSFLRVDSEEHNLKIYAVVYNVITGSPDNVHRPSVLGMSREQLKVEQPHIFSLLRTEVHALNIGFASDKGCFHHLPPQPPEVHDFVFLADASEIRAVTSGFEFLRLLSTVSEVPADELLAASIREANQATGERQEFLVAAGVSLSHLLRSDYDRLVSVLRNIKR